MEVPTYSPREIVSELDRFIVGQNDAKRAVAIAMQGEKTIHLPALPGVGPRQSAHGIAGEAEKAVGAGHDGRGPPAAAFDP